jgi:hypothetical protein
MEPDGLTETVSAQEMIDEALHDPFDHDGFVVSVRRGLTGTVATAVHPDGEFICRAIRPHRSLAKLGYWAAALLVISLGLVGIIAVLTNAPMWAQGLVTVLSIVYLILAVGIAIAFAPASPVVLRLDREDLYNALPVMVLHRSRRFALSGQSFDLRAEGGEKVAGLRRSGSSQSDYSLGSREARDLVRFVPSTKSRNGALLASLLSPFGLMAALFVLGTPPDSWVIVRPKERIRLGSLVMDKSELGDFVLDLTDDLERWADRRLITLAALAVVLNRVNAR